MINLKGKIIGNFEINEIRFFIFFDYYIVEDAQFHTRFKAHVFYSSFGNESNEGFSKFSFLNKIKV